MLRRQLLGLFGIVFLESDELAHLLSGSAVDAKSVEGLERTAHGLYAVYTTAPHHELRAATQSQFRILTGLLGNSLNTAHQTALFSLSGRLATLLGALSADLDEADSKAWYRLAARFGQQAGDASLRADALDNQAYDAALIGDIKEVQRLAQGIEAEAGRNLNASHLAWYVALRQAWVHAALGEIKACFDALDRAERSFAAAPSNLWHLGHADEIWLASNRGRCLLLLGKPEVAEPILREALTFRGPERVVSRALLSLDLGIALADQNHLEEACRLAGDALTIPSDYQLASVTRRAKELRVRLEPWSAHPAVRDFDDQLQALTF